MKIKIMVVLIMAICMVGCSGAKGTTSIQVQSEEPTSAMRTVGDLTVEIIDVHKTTDSHGDPIMAIEFKFKNGSDEAMQFSGNVMVDVFQDNIEIVKDQMWLDNDYDWGTSDTAIKNGAEISVFVPYPLRNTESPVEINAGIYNSETREFENATKTFEIN